MYIFIYIYIYIRIHTCIHIYMYICMYICIHTYIHTYIHTCIRACMHICIRAHHRSTCMYPIRTIIGTRYSYTFHEHFQRINPVLKFCHVLLYFSMYSAASLAPDFLHHPSRSQELFRAPFSGNCARPSYPSSSR